MEGTSSVLEEKGLRVARRRFRVALGLFFVWVVALGILAVVSGRRPAPSPASIEER